MAPTEFNDIGKTVRDLLTKDYNFGKAKIEAKTTTKSGVEFTSSLERADPDGGLKGEVKTKLKHADSGLVFTDTYNSNNDLNIKVEAPELVDGLKLDLETSFQPYPPKKEVKLGYTFKGDSFITTACANVFQSPKIKADAVIGHEGFIAGAQLTFDVASSGLSDYAAAVGYAEAEYGVTVHANRKLTSFVTTYNHNVSKDVTVAAQATWGSSDKSILIEFGTQYKLDADSTIKTRFDSSGKVGLGYQQKLRPDLKASFGFLIDTRNLDQNAHKFGYSLAFEPK